MGRGVHNLVQNVKPTESVFLVWFKLFLQNGLIWKFWENWFMVWFRSVSQETTNLQKLNPHWKLSNKILTYSFTTRLWLKGNNTSLSLTTRSITYETYELQYQTSPSLELIHTNSTIHLAMMSLGIIGYYHDPR